MKIPNDLKKCIEYHGHLCSGLLMGYRASKGALKKIKEMKAKDEELIAIVENDSCFIDAVGVITGCTFGKGNLIFKDYGKMVLKLLSRRSLKGVRVSFRREIFNNDKKLPEIMNKVFQKKANKEEIKYFEKIKKERERLLLNLPDEKILNIVKIKEPLIEKAKIFNSFKCYKCNEMVMETKLKKTEKGFICLECLENIK